MKYSDGRTLATVPVVPPRIGKVTGMPQKGPNRPTRYGVALAGVVLAIVLRQALNPFLGTLFPFATVFFSVLFAAWIGGLGPALVATVLGAVGSAIFLLPPEGELTIEGAENRSGMVLYTAVGFGIAFMGGAMREARNRAQRSVEEADAERERLSVTLASIGDGVITTDSAGRVTLVNPVAETLTGWRTDEARGRPIAEVFHIINEETRKTVENPVDRALSDGTIVGLANHTLLIARDGTERPIDDSAAPIRDDLGRIIGVVLVFRDVTERRQAEVEIRASQEQFRTMVEAMPQIAWISRNDRSVLQYLNRRWFDYTGLSEEESYREGGWAVAVHPDDLELLDRISQESEGPGGSLEVEYRLRSRDGQYRWFLGRALPVRDDQGRQICRLGTATDIEDRKRAELGSRFLARAGSELASLVDEASTLSRVAGLAVPAFADWCAVDLLDDRRELSRVAVAHVDPEKIALALDLQRRYPPRVDAPRGLWQVIRSGESEMVTEITDEMLVAGAQDEEHLRLVRELQLRSYMCVPLNGREGTLGALTFVWAESGRHYDATDLQVAEDLAIRAVVAIENSRLYDRLKEADRRKDDFLATLAHELRNPLGPIRNAALLLQNCEESTAEERQSILKMITRQVGTMSRLIDDLMDLARITRSKLDLRVEPIELAELVRRAAESARSGIDERGHTLRIALPEEPILLNADPTRIEQVIWNLLNNAAKYTDPGGQIDLMVERDGSEVVIRVKDSGIGMDPEMIPRVFDPFMQLPAGSRRTQGGLGIGLGLVRSLVQLHGGSISARSDGPGQGSEFVVRLPVAVEGGSQITDPSASSTRSGKPERHRILVVDDNADAALTLARILERLYGQEVQVAHDGASALATARAFHPDVIVLDIGMADMDGYEVARRLRQEAEFSRTILVALTGWGQASDRRRSRESGFDHHLVKPVEPRDLIAFLPNVPARDA